MVIVGRWNLGVFGECWWMRGFDGCSIYTFWKRGLHIDIERSWTRKLMIYNSSPQFCND